MRFNVPLIFVMLFFAVFGVVCLVFGLWSLASPFLDLSQTSFDSNMAWRVFLGLWASVGGVFLLGLSWNYLTDLVSRPVTITGQVSGRREIPSGNPNIPFACYVTVGNEEFKVTTKDFEKATEGRFVDVTYLRGTGTVETVTPVAPSWLIPTVAALAKSIAANDDWNALPILADALEEAGCTDVEMLRQCRESDEKEGGFAVVEEIMQLIEEFGDPSR